VATVGGSELAREKPFQPGGSNNPKTLITQSVLGGVGTVVDKATGSKIAGSAPEAPPIDTSAIDIANKAREAANAVQTADAEGRRARNAKRQSSVLGSYQAKSQINAATLQPAQPRRSVLG
jgi:hypothetical protein